MQQVDEDFSRLFWSQNMENVVLRNSLCTYQLNEFPSSDLYHVSLSKCLLNLVFIAFSFRGVTVEQSYGSCSILIRSIECRR